MKDQKSRQDVINQCKFELATNFECPSEQILGVYGSRLGLNSREMYELLASQIQ